MNIIIVGEMLLRLTIIVISCDLFTRGAERLGYYSGLSKHSVGRVIAAIGTALPETIVPIIAIFRGGHAGKDIGLGAALGSTFMLGTLAMFVGGISIIAAYLAGKRDTIKLNIDLEAFKYDVIFFLLAYLIIRIAILFETDLRLLATVLIVLYAIYAYLITRGEAVGEEGLPELIGPENFANALLHLLIGTLGIIIGAKFFVHDVALLAEELNVDPFVLSVFITPIATELPEKTNSVIRYIRSKDDYALGNITGAMVFQATIVIAIVMLYARRVDKLVEELIVINLLAALYLALIVFTKKANGITLTLAGALYLLYAYLALAM